MFERFTDAARRVVVYAQEECRELRHREISSEHLLLGVLHTEDPVLRGVLTPAGVELSAVRALLRPGSRWRRPSGHLPFTPDANAVLERSLALANRGNRGHISPAVLLIALLQAEISRATLLLRTLGVDTDALMADVVGTDGTERTDEEPL